MILISKNLLLNVLLWWGIEAADRWILSLYISDTEIGIYSAGARIAGIAMAIVLMLYQSWQVYGVRALHVPERPPYFFKEILDWYSLGASIVFSLLISFSSPLSRLIFGGEFNESGNYAALLIPALFISSICYYFGIIYFSNRASSAWRSAVVGLLVSVGANFLLVPMIGAVAAPIALFLSFLAILHVRYREAKDELGVALNFRNFLLPVVILATQACGVVHNVSPTILLAGPLILVLMNARIFHSILNDGMGSIGISR